jgi:hypothetical protein
MNKAAPDLDDFQKIKYQRRVGKAKRAHHPIHLRTVLTRKSP